MKDRFFELLVFLGLRVFAIALGGFLVCALWLAVSGFPPGWVLVPTTIGWGIASLMAAVLDSPG